MSQTSPLYRLVHDPMNQEDTIMTQRLDALQISGDLFKKYLDFSMALRTSSIEQKLRDLVTLRASQINGCGFCLDMHVKEAKLHGERELRLYHVAIWRESTLFDARERAVLEWAEVLTKCPEQGVPDHIYRQVREQLSEKEIVDLTFIVMSINGWNRLNIALRTTPGSMDEMLGLTKAGLR